MTAGSLRGRRVLITGDLAGGLEGRDSARVAMERAGGR
jgi:hypothetical protein